LRTESAVPSTSRGARSWPRTSSASWPPDEGRDRTLS
jgi:hypothetical protein